jgi:hypothetical protein
MTIWLWWYQEKQGEDSDDSPTSTDEAETGDDEPEGLEQTSQPTH